MRILGGLYKLGMTNMRGIIRRNAIYIWQIRVVKLGE
jgi:hypothetical protein